MVYQGELLRIQVHELQAVHFVRPQQAPAVGGPQRTVFVGVATGGELSRRLAPVLWLEVKLVLAARIGHVSDPLAVR